MGKAKEWAFQEVGQHEQMQGTWKQWKGKSVALCGQEVKMRVGVMEDEMGRTSGSLGCQDDKRGNEHQLQARHCLLVSPHNVIALWSESILCIISILFNVLRLFHG